MKKVLLTFALIAGTAFTANAQCGEDSTLVSTGCASACLTVEVGLTQNLAADASIAAANSPYRKSNIREILAFADYLASLCD